MNEYIYIYIYILNIHCSRFITQYLKFATQFSIWAVNLLPIFKIDYSKYSSSSLLSYFIFNLCLLLKLFFNKITKGK